MEINAAEANARWFQNLLADKRLSQRQLAKRMGLDPAAVSLMIHGKRKMSAVEASELARQLGVTVDEVLLHAGSTPTVPVSRREREGYVLRIGSQPAQDVRDVQAMQPVQPVRAVSASQGQIEVPVPMSDGTVATLLLPRALGRSDAERIAALVQALAMP